MRQKNFKQIDWAVRRQELHFNRCNILIVDSYASERKNFYKSNFKCEMNGYNVSTLVNK